MPFRIACPFCSAQTIVSDDLVGQIALCGNCDHPIIIGRLPLRDSANSVDYDERTNVASRYGRTRASSPELVITDDRPRPRRFRLSGCIVCFFVLGLLVLLAALFLPAVGSRPHRAAYRVHCANNLKQIAIALHNYHDTYGALPPPYVADSEGNPMHSWRVLLLPFLEQTHLFDQYDFDEPWNGPNNIQLAFQMPEVYSLICPADRSRVPGTTNYMLIVGNNAFFETGKSTKFSDILDGMSNTIMVVEVAGSTTNWMEPRNLDLQSLRLEIDATHDGRNISSWHQGGANVVMGDASVHFLAHDLSPETLLKMIDRRDGQRIDESLDW